MKSGTGCVQTFFLEFLVRQTLLLEQHLRERKVRDVVLMTSATAERHERIEFALGGA